MRIVLKNYYCNIIKLDLVNKFHYKTISCFPKIKKIVLKFKCNTSSFKIVTAVFLSTEIITAQKTILTISKKSNISLKIKKGIPVSCKIVLKNHRMLLFLSKLINEVFSRLKDFKKFKVKQKNEYITAMSFQLKNNLVFLELEKNYHLFSKLPLLNIMLITNKINKQEFRFLFNSLKIFHIIAKITQKGRV